MDKEYRYRAVQRIAGSDAPWVKLTGATFKSEEDVQGFIEKFRQDNEFFRWGREYAYERQHYTDWEHVETGE